ncbi:hypothetical protein [Acanthopleuribacter pedis]|uniref:POTRA domain-containing protein n=1 Tax=Acanthopleuribacter pedis TaxID=442870 RepID=A0A8J7Q1G2_9BACT|nr:hypothetical protein [Acanthopleuribacter pedis]MBO1317490.1 hypothetical protein [Acanthopleuribacter pedis]
MLSLLLWTCLVFQNPTSPAEFPLTAIEVDGARWGTEAVIRSESGLKEGKTYTERALASARRRIARLPFVLEVDFSMKKGTSYGTYTLVIGIVETMPLVFRLQYIDTDSNRRPIEDFDLDEIDRRSLDGVGDWSIGARWFFGKHAMVYATTRFFSEDGSLDFADGKPVDFGLTHYNLLNKRVLFNLNFQWTERITEEIFDRRPRERVQFTRERPILAALTLAVPVQGNHWLSFTADSFEEELTFEQPRRRMRTTIKDERLRGRLGWFYDSSDDAVLATSGRRIESGFTFNTQTTTFGGIDFSPLPPPAISRRETERLLWNLRWQEYPTLSQRINALIDLNGEVRLRGDDFQAVAESGERVPDRLPFNQWSLQVGARLDVLGHAGNGRYGELKLDLTAGWGVANEERLSEETTELNLALTWRHRWGLARFVVRWEDIREDERRPPRPPQPKLPAEGVQ